jgi:glycosyltransferase involved in cell wall biosynthesis
LLQTPSIPLDINQHGGLERVALRELEFLRKKKIDARLYVAHLVGHKDHVFEIRDLGWQSRLLKFFYYFKFWRLNRRADIFHGHYTPILALLFPKKSLVHFHGIAIRELILYRFGFCRNRYHRAHYIFCARWVRDKFKESYPNIPESHLHLVYNGIDVDTIKPRPGKSSGKTVNICFYGRWVEKKGIYDVLEAAEILETKGRRDFIIWYGGWSDSTGVQEKIRDWAARLTSVRLVGVIRPDELASFLEDKDVGLVPSTYPDPFPLVPLEMMSAGLPVIAYSVGGLRESIVEDESGLLVESQDPVKLAEKIEFLLDNRDEITRMGRAARKRVVQNFTWEKHVAQLGNIYNEILERG